MLPTAFTADVETFLPGVPNPLIERNVILTAVDFCQRTEAVYRTVEAIPLPASADIFTVPVDTETLLRAIKTVTWNNGRPLRPSQSRQMHAWLPINGDPRAYSQMNSPTEAAHLIRVYPNPTVAGVLVVTYSLQPQSTATQIPDECGVFYETLLHGVVARLASMPGRPWFNQAVSGEQWRRFFVGCTSAKVDALGEFVGAEAQVDARPFA